jgi:FMN phosphatase YigB (HAD superfamily)
MEGIKNIIFDYGNVIFNIDFKRVAKAWEQLGVTNAAEFYGHREQDFRDRIKELTHKPELTDVQIDGAWNSIFVGIPEGNHELLLKVKEKYRTFLLSNINAIHHDYVHNYLKSDFGLDDNTPFFEKIYYSHLVGKRKPGREIFEQVLQENNLNPAETLFIDDSPQHIATAKELGIHTYLMTAPDTIQQFFDKDGIV